MNETETAAQQSDQNMLSSTANFFKQWEKQITGLMTAVLTTLLTWIVYAGVKQPFGYNITLTILIFSLPGAMFGVLRFGYTPKEIAAGILCGAVSAIAALAMFAILMTVNLILYDIENIVLVSAGGVWWILTTMGRGIYRKYENYFIPFLLFVSVPSVYAVFFVR